MVGTWSYTGHEQAMAELMAELFEECGLALPVAAGRGRARERARHLGGSGRRHEPDVQRPHRHLVLGPRAVAEDVPGFQPEAFVQDGRLYGLGISNMKGALACYVEAVRALQDAGVRLRGDVLIAAVCGEIEKTQYGDAVGAEYRGYAAGTRYLVSHGGVADMCLLGEPTEGKVVLGHFGALWLRIRVHGGFIHTAFSEGRRSENSILRMHEVLDGGAASGSRPGRTTRRTRYRGAKAIVNVGAIDGGFGWRVSRTPHHTDLCLDVRVPPTKPMAVARREVLELVRGLAERFPDYGVEGEVYVTAPGAEIDEGHALVAAIDEAHDEVFGEPPGRDVTRWFSDASALTRYGIPTVNYGTSTGLMDVELGENLEIDGLVRTAEVYARWRCRSAGWLSPALCSSNGTRSTEDDTREAGDVRRGRGAGRDARGRGDRRPRRADDAAVLRARRRGRDRRARRARRHAAARPDRPEEVLPHRRELPRARGRVEERRLVARHRAVDQLLPERRRDRRAGRAGDLPRAPHRGARLRARARGVLRKPGKWFSPEEATDYVGGYVIFNDLTARDIQRGEMRSGVFSFCKAIDTFCPLGPWIVTPDEIPDPHDLAMQLRVNGEVRQESHSGHMSVTIPEILSNFSGARLLGGRRALDRHVSRASPASSRPRSARGST